VLTSHVRPHRNAGAGSKLAGRFPQKALACKHPAQLAALIAETGRSLAGVENALVLVLPAEGRPSVVAGTSPAFKPQDDCPRGLLRYVARTGRSLAWAGAMGTGVWISAGAGSVPERGSVSQPLKKLWRQDTAWLRLQREPGRVFMLPLGTWPAAAGVLVLLDGRRSAWSKPSMAALAWFGSLAGMALEACEQRRRFEYRLRQSSAVAEIAQNINSTLDPDILLRLIILEITKAMGCQAGDIWLREERRQALQFQTSLGLSPASRGKALAGGFTRQALETGEPVQAAEADRAADLDVEIITREGIVSLVAAPLKTKNNVIGVMHLFARQPKAFTREELLLLKTLTSQASLAIENARLFNDTKRRAQELLGLYEVAQVISEMSNLHAALGQIVERVGSILNVEKCWFLFWDEQRQELAAQKAAVGAEEEQLALLHFRLESTGVSAQVFRTAKPFYSNEAETEPLVQADFHTVFKLRNVMAVPLRSREQTLGVFFAGNKRDDGLFTGNDVRLFRTLASEATVVIQNAHLYDKLRRSYFSIVQVVSEMIDARERYTRGHSERVSAYATLIAKQLKLPADQVETITIAGLLHDIGKIGIADRILLKPGRLNGQEFLTIQNHPVIGENILRSVEMPWNILPAVRHHHEQFTGGGYPDGLAGEAIPLEARILAVADAFDVITTSRLYQRARSLKSGFDELEKEAGKQFDPAVVKAFHEGWPEFMLESPEGKELQTQAGWAEEEEGKS
jgi:putative nucleotidyltransferase with HDIG domain